MSLRYFNPYGARSYNPANTFAAYSPVVGIFRNQAESGEAITVTGDGEQRRDFIHVKDVAAANLLVAEKIDVVRDQVFNVGAGRHRAIIEIARLFSDNITHIPAREGEARIGCADPSRLMSHGWVPSIELEQAIAEGLL